MPKPLFYSGTAFCLFLALSAGGDAIRAILGEGLTLVAFGYAGFQGTTPAAGIAVALVTAIGCALIVLRMAALLAARNLFAAFVTLFAVSCTLMSLTATILIQSRILVSGVEPALIVVHLGGTLMIGGFLSLALLALRPYFLVHSNALLAALVAVPLPIFLTVLVRELLTAPSKGFLPAASAATIAFLASVSVVFFSIALHCIRHRYLFIETTNLRGLLDSRADAADRPSRPLRLGFDS